MISRSSTCDPVPLLAITHYRERMIKVGIVGLGKMGLSHYALMHAHPRLRQSPATTPSTCWVLERNTGVSGYGDYETMLAEADLDAVVIATPSSAHAPMVRAAFDKGLHVFCEKQLTLSPEDSDDLTVLARERGLVTQVGYHNRFVGAFREVRALLDKGIENPIVGSNINKIGFRIRGGIETWVRAMRERDFRAIAMSVCASEAIPPTEAAIEWACGLPNLSRSSSWLRARAASARRGNSSISTR